MHTNELSDQKKIFNQHDIKTKSLDIIDYAIILLVWGSVITYSGILGMLPGSFIRYTCFGIAAFVGIIKISSSKASIPPEMIVLLLFIFIAFSSLTISIEKVYTFTRALNFILLWFFLAGLYCSMKSTSFNRVVTTLFQTYLSVILVNFGLLLTNVPLAWQQDRFQGIVGHPNSMAAICMTMYPLLMLLRNKMEATKPYFLTLAFCATFLIHIFTKSRASLAISVLGLSLYFLLTKRKLIYLVIPLWFVCLVLFVNYMYFGKTPSFPEAVESYIVREESLESIKSFTGRIEIWKFSLQKFSERPLLGYGYDVEGHVFDNDYDFKRNFAPWLLNYPTLARLSLHNGYLSILIGTGLCGFIVWLYLLFCPFPLLLKLSDNFTNFKRCFLMMMIMGLCINLFEYSIDGGRGFFSITFWILWTVLLKFSRTSLLPSTAY